MGIHSYPMYKEEFLGVSFMSIVFDGSDAHAQQLHISDCHCAVKLEIYVRFRERRRSRTCTSEVSLTKNMQIVAVNWMCAPTTFSKSAAYFFHQLWKHWLKWIWVKHNLRERSVDNPSTSDTAFSFPVFLIFLSTCRTTGLCTEPTCSINNMLLKNSFVALLWDLCISCCVDNLGITFLC